MLPMRPDERIGQMDWRIITADRFLDGGTWVIGLQDSSNLHVIVFLVINFSLSVEHPYRKVYLSDLEGGSDMIEVLPNSPLEKRLIEDLESISYGYRVDPDKMPDIDRIIEIVKTRDLSLRLEDPL